MDAAQWPQGIGLVKQMEEMTSNTCTNRPILDKKPRPQEQLNCPRCNSNNTKFCYYNNYSLSQPRYFCKSCRRYWTEGGTLRNVPVGGGSRKNKRSSSSASSSTSSKVPDLNPPNLSQFSSQNPKIHESQDLNLAFPMPQDYHSVSHVLHVPKVDSGDTNHNLSSTSTSSSLSALEMLRTGMASRGFSSLIANPIQDSNAMYSSGFPLHEVKPNLRFSIDSEFENRNGNLQGLQGSGGRLLFPFVEQKELSIANEVPENKGQGNPAEYNWNGLFSTGRSW